MEKSLRFFLISSLSFLFFFVSVFAYVAESPSYRLQTDSVNVGGLDNSSSASYGLSDTIGEVGIGNYEDASEFVKAGYRAMETGDSSISISLPSNVTMSPNIDGINGATSTGSASWTVTTENPAGYSLFIKSSQSPALQSSSDSFADYTPSLASMPDLNWIVGATAAEFGYTVEGTDTHNTFKDNGTSCGTGSGNGTDTCWLGFSTTDREIARRSSGAASGVVTTVKFKAELGADKTIAPASYSAEITATAIAL